VTAGEDQNFFSHHGLAPVRIAGAFVSNLDQTHRLQGGSTITQQLARNFFLTAEPTWRRKISEAFIALILEAVFFSKMGHDVHSLPGGDRAHFFTYGAGRPGSRRDGVVMTPSGSGSQESF
jgi:hypothetical protein